MININSYFKEIFDNLGLIYILAKRDLKVRYSQTVLGIFWSFVKPISTLLVFIFMFKKIANISEIKGVPIQLIILSGIISWNFFSNSFNSVSSCISQNSNLITKVYFPRLILAISTLAVSIVDFLFSLIVFIALSIYFDNGITFEIIGVPLALFFTCLLSLGIGLLFASNSIKYRDLNHVGPLIIQYGFFVTPVIYSVQSVSLNEYMPIYYIINPLVGIIEMIRFSLLDNYFVNWVFISYSIVSIIFIFIIGISVFIKNEKSFVDYL